MSGGFSVRRIIQRLPAMIIMRSVEVLPGSGTREHFVVQATRGNTPYVVGEKLDREEVGTLMASEQIEVSVTGTHSFQRMEIVL